MDLYVFASSVICHFSDHLKVLWWKRRWNEDGTFRDFSLLSCGRKSSCKNVCCSESVQSWHFLGIIHPSIHTCVFYNERRSLWGENCIKLKVEKVTCWTIFVHIFKKRVVFVFFLYFLYYLVWFLFIFIQLFLALDDSVGCFFNWLSFWLPTCFCSNCFRFFSFVSTL